MSVIYGQPITLGGKKAEGEIPITANGIYDVAEYATANVNVQSAPVLLWTNASPTTSFYAQTVNLDASDFSGFLVELRASTTDAVYATVYIPFGYANFMAVSYDTTRTTVRQVREASATGINFGSSSAANCIPTRIWGVKFTL